MITKSEARNLDRYSKMAWLLNHDAYLLQMKGRIRPLKEFHPCPKGIVFTAAMSETPVPVTTIVIPRAALQICNCHPHVGEKELWDLWDTTKDTGQK